MEAIRDIDGLVFKIKRFSIHDGPGIRTSVFLKGCPLKCDWCHSPEGIDSEISIWHNPSLCIGCCMCTDICNQNALKLVKNQKSDIIINRNLCKKAGDCIRVCPTNAIQFTGYLTSVDEIINEVSKDIVYYQSSGGGVTLTGGEPLYQPFFSAEILKSCKEREIHTAIETSLFCSRNDLNAVMDHIDLFIVDLKIFSADKHITHTGKSNKIIKENFHYIGTSGKRIIVRIPLVKEISDTTENIDSILKFVNEINEAIPIEYVKYNPLTRNNYNRLGIPFLYKTLEDKYLQ